MDLFARPRTPPNSPHLPRSPRTTPPAASASPSPAPRNRSLPRRTRPPRGARRRHPPQARPRPQSRPPRTRSAQRHPPRRPHDVDAAQLPRQSHARLAHLPDIAARSTNRALVHQPTKINPNDPNRLPEAAAAIVRLATSSPAVAEATATPALAAHTPKLRSNAVLRPRPSATSTRPSTCRSSPSSCAWNRPASASTPASSPHMSTRLAVEIDTLAERIYAHLPASLQHQLAQAARRRPLQQNGPPQAAEVRQGQSHLHRAGRPRRTRRAPRRPRTVLEYRQLAKLNSTYLDSLPHLVDAEGRVHTTFNQVGTATGRLSSTNPNLQNIPIRTALGREIRAAFIAAPGNLLMSADYSQIELRLMAHFSQDPLLLNAYRTGQDIHTLTASEVFGVPVAHGQGNAQPRQGRQLRHRLRHLAPSASRATRHRPARSPASISKPTSSATRASAASSTRPSKPSAATRRPHLLRPHPPHPRHPVAATPTCAASPNAPPSTRRCRAPPPTSSSSPCSASTTHHRSAA